MDNNKMISQIYAKAGTPFGTREESVRAMRALMGEASPANNNDGEEDNEPSATTTTAAAASKSNVRAPPRPPLSNVHGKGPLLTSDIPASSRSPGVCVGIDEAGRGSVLGPMVYGAAFWNASLDNDTTKIPPGFHDSKQLTDEIRSNLLEQLMAANDIGWCARILHASELSRNMLRAGLPYNLNQMSHDAAMAMIAAIQEAGVPIQTCYIDTVGNPELYRRKLEQRFPNLEFVVESKADAKYATCSAASVVAKVVRDRMLESWEFTEPFHATAAAVTNNNSSATATSNNSDPTKHFGSGYPSDPKCKKWMHDNLRNPVFGWPDIVRFSWGPAKKALLADAALVQFEADDDDEDNNHHHHNSSQTMDAAALAGRKRQQDHMGAFLKKGKKDLRLPYFERNNLKAVTNIF